jgi:hypothetical protein
MQNVVTIHVTKSPVALLYPLTYRKTVNYFPLEKIQYTHACKDGALETSPTCGWYYLDGTKVQDSQVLPFLLFTLSKASHMYELFQVSCLSQGQVHV